MPNWHLLAHALSVFFCFCFFFLASRPDREHERPGSGWRWLRNSTEQDIPTICNHHTRHCGIHLTASRRPAIMGRTLARLSSTPDVACMYRMYMLRMHLLLPLLVG